MRINDDSSLDVYDYSDSGNCQTLTIEGATTDTNGDFKMTISPRTDNNREDVYIQSVRVYAEVSSADPEVSISNTSNIITEGTSSISLSMNMS